MKLLKYALLAANLCLFGMNHWASAEELEDMKRLFVSPPESARPCVYWYFMDGNLSKEGMTKDL